MDDEQLRRIAENEVLFREVNEHVEGTAQEFYVHGDTPQAFICECADSSCVDRVALTLDEYEEVRANPRRFFVVPGHEVAEAERVVAERRGYNVIEKSGSGGRIAEERDPRARDARG